MEDILPLSAKTTFYTVLKAKPEPFVLQHEIEYDRRGALKFF